jgi:hypothetical protein
MMRSLDVPIALLAAAVTPLHGQGQGCADTKYPPELPPPSALVDSAHAIADLAAFADPSKPMLFSVVFNQGDSVARVRALDKNDAAAAVSLTNYVRHQPPGDLWAIRVRIVGGDAPALTLARSKYCPPISRSGNTPYATRADISGSITPYGNPSPTSEPSVAVPPGAVIPVEALISVEGSVVMARVIKSSGNTETDARIMRDLRQQKFEPAKLDGQPIQAVYRLGAEPPRP